MKPFRQSLPVDDTGSTSDNLESLAIRFKPLWHVFLGITGLQGRGVADSQRGHAGRPNNLVAVYQQTTIHSLSKQDQTTVAKRRSRSRRPRSGQKSSDTQNLENQPLDDAAVAAEDEPVETPLGAPPEVDMPPESEFLTMGLSAITLQALRAAGYLEPTPVQAGLIPRALAGVDTLGQAQTGTGKTAAFCIPILEQLEPSKRGAPPQALILTPTRELAVQVRDECAKLAAGRRIHVVALYGGKPIRQQIDKLHRGAEIVVGTPGRVMDLMQRTALMLDRLRFVVLDEADRMLDIGFRPDIEKILRRCPDSRQTLLLSATIPGPVERLARRYMRDPEALDFSPKDIGVETIEQFYFTVDQPRKQELLLKLLQRENPAQAIVFCRTRRGTERVHRKIASKHPDAASIHGDLPQRVRDRVMRDFRDGKVRILVATDVVGRGIDVSSISHIINFDIPEFCDDYVHRVGRTGRMGREGVAYTFVTPEEGNELTRVECRINRLLKRAEISGFDDREAPKPAATEQPQADRPTPEGDQSELPAEPERKPVFGSRSRRYRRAL